MAFEIIAEPREQFGKQKCKQLRESGRLPGVLYGGGLKENLNFTVDLKSTERTMKENGRAADYSLSLGGKTYAVRIGEVRREPIRKGFLHLDLIVKAGKAG
jgi:large subunit ribosomal protein L25